MYLCSRFVLLQLKHIQLVFQYTTCRNRLNLCVIFVKLILKIHNLVPNTCVTIKYLQLLWHLRTTCYRLKFWLIAIGLTTHHSLRALFQNGGWKCFWSLLCHHYCAVAPLFVRQYRYVWIFCKERGRLCRFTASVCISARSTEQRDSFLNSGNTRVDQSFGE